jgi:hypothetical protein
MIPKITNNLKISNKEIDKALAANLDNEGLLRLKSVDQVIAFSMGKNVNQKEFQALYETVYKFLTNNNENVSEQSNPTRSSG